VTFWGCRKSEMSGKCIERPVLQEIWFFFCFGHKHLVSRILEGNRFTSSDNLGSWTGEFDDNYLKYLWEIRLLG
jgi:hypothetical protein